MVFTCRFARLDVLFKRIDYTFTNKMKIVRDLFLRCISSVYLFAFASLYVQIPGQFYNGLCKMRGGAAGRT